MPVLATWPLPLIALLFLASGAVVWIAGGRLAADVDRLAERTGMGQGFAGLMLLGGITSLPEVAVTVSAALAGNPVLAVNNVLGAVALQVTILGLADMLLGREALTSVVTRPVVLLQGVLGMAMLALIAMAITAGDVPLGPVGAWSLVILLAYVGGVALLAAYEDRPPPWRAEGDGKDQDARPESDPARGRSLSGLLGRISGAALAILLAGWALSASGEAAAQQTGLGSAFFGATVLALATSLPEISTVFAAVRLRRFEMALGDIFGTNLFNAMLIFVVDLLSSGGPVLGRVGAFSAFGALLALVLTAIFIAGVIERRDRTVLNMGLDSLAALIVYAAGVGVLFALRGSAGA